MSKFFCICVLLCFCISNLYCDEPFYLKGKFQSARPGDYIVTAQDNTYSLLLLRSVSGNQLILEEVSIPSQHVNLKTIDWREWLIEKAPGHTSWTLYEIDLERGELLECFSCSKKGWIYLDQQEQFFAKLFALPFALLQDAQRKRIGPQPLLGESDHRRIWNPPLVLEGKKDTKPVFNVFCTRWPEDNSPLSLCLIEMYFDAQHPLFPFPYWIEVKGSHYAFKVRCVESGHSLASPVTMSMPHRPCEDIRLSEKNAQFWKLSLRAPLYHESLKLLALDLSSDTYTAIPIPHRFERESRTEMATLQISIEDLKKILTPTHRYQWILFSDKTPSHPVKSEEAFTWSG